MAVSRLRFGLSAVVVAAIGIGLAARATVIGTPVAAPAASPEGLIAHEWGTFTSFAGPDGKVRAFETYVGPGSDLPDYVHTWGSEGTREGSREVLSDKFLEMALQRMETPVIYFYTGTPQTLRVEARILSGRMTEFYPPVTATQRLPREQQDRVVWEAVQVAPTNPGERLTMLRGDKPESHYYRARETESSVIHVDAAGKRHHEKFLFYRGLANFESKVGLKALGGGRFKMTNTTGQRISAAFIVKVEGKQVQFARFGPIAEEAELKLPTEFRSGDELAAELRAALSADGLYPMEAAAMVHTWNSQWLGEPGTRVLYLIPAAEIDRLVPLTITPTPTELKRVFVGRLDVLAPEDVVKLEGVIKSERVGPLLADFEYLGRFKGPALQYVAESGTDAEARDRVRKMLGR